MTKTALELFETFRKESLDNGENTAEDIATAKQVYYAGMYDMFVAVTHAAKELSHEDHKNWLFTRNTEFQMYFNHVGPKQ